MDRPKEKDNLSEYVNQKELESLEYLAKIVESLGNIGTKLNLEMEYQKILLNNSQKLGMI